MYLYTRKQNLYLENNTGSQQTMQAGGRQFRLSTSNVAFHQTMQAFIFCVSVRNACPVHFWQQIPMVTGDVMCLCPSAHCYQCDIVAAGNRTKPVVKCKVGSAHWSNDVCLDWHTYDTKMFRDRSLRLHCPRCSLVSSLNLLFRIETNFCRANHARWPGIVFPYV